MRLTIMRGVQGSGKTRYVKNHFPHASVCSADSFFERLGTWNPRYIMEAHKECFNTCIKYMDEGRPHIVVDNVNALVRHFQHYVEEADKRGYNTDIIRLDVNPYFAATRNIHKVPLKTILKMHKLMERCPPQYNERVI